MFTSAWISVPKTWGPTVLESQRWRKCGEPRSFPHWAQHSLEVFQCPGGAVCCTSGVPALEPFRSSIHRSASGSAAIHCLPHQVSLWYSVLKQLKHPFPLLLVNLLTVFHGMELFCFTKSKYSHLWRWWKWASTWNENILCDWSDRKTKYLLLKWINSNWIVYFLLLILNVTDRWMKIEEKSYALF